MTFGEPLSWEKKTKQNLWICGVEGCTHLLCTSCGSNFDGCQIHSRYHRCLIWLSIWGPRAWQGFISPLASIVHPVAPVITAAHINPPQIDAPPLIIAAADAVPLADLTNLIDLDADDLLQPAEDPAISLVHQ